MNQLPIHFVVLRELGGKLSPHYHGAYVSKSRTEGRVTLYEQTNKATRLKIENDTWYELVQA